MRLTRRKLLATGTALVASAALGGLIASTAFSRERGAGPTGVMWFSRQGEWDGGDDVVLEFVDELGNPVDFNALLLWEPTGDVEEVSVRNGKLKLGRGVLKKQVDQGRLPKGEGPPARNREPSLCAYPHLHSSRIPGLPRLNNGT